MEENTTVAPAPDDKRFFQKHLYLVLVAISIVLSLILVSVSLYLYTSSGASQLDLSRPGYKKVAEQAEADGKVFQSFPSTGGVSAGTIDEFTKQFDEKSTQATEVDAFSGDPLDPEVLQISAPSN